MLFLGSTSQIMVWQEEGTKYIPPRPVIGTTMFQAIPSINYIMGGMLFSFVSGKKLVLREKTHSSKG
jgi:hypothetical protein